MKVAPRDAERACLAPSADWTGALLYGADQGLVAERRRQLVAAVTGQGGTDLQVTQIPAPDARRTPADIAAALTTRGFFAGRPVVVIDGATDGLAGALEPILKESRPDDGFLVLTADQLPARSKLRKLFETAADLAAIGLYPQAMATREIEDFLARRGAPGLSSSAAAMLTDLAAEMNHGAYRQFLEVVAIYAMDRRVPLDLHDIEGLAPMGLDGDIDGFVMAVAEGETSGVGPGLRRLAASGANAVGVAIALQRHFCALLTAAGSKDGIAALRPQPQGPRRDRIQRQLRLWSASRLEQANRLLFEVDARLRSSAPPPEFALLERAALRLAMLAPR